MNATHRGQAVKLGRPNVSPRVMGPKRLMAARLLDSLPAPPPTCDWLKAAEAQALDGNLGAMENNALGCCTISAPGHASQIWTANNGTMVTPPDSLILADYERVDGYVAGDASTDNGGIIANVMAAWKAAGGVAGSQIDDYVPIPTANLDYLRKAIYRYGVVDGGVGLPLTAQNQVVWTVAIGGGASADPSSWGGHSALFVAYDEDSFTIETWGMRQKASIDFVLAYFDETWAPMCKALWAPNGTAPNGYTAADLDADLVAIAG